MKDSKNKLKTIAIVGRPNVGKSSLFNEILGRRKSIVHEQSGVTRDRVVAPCAWRGKHFLLMDTGGLAMLDGQTKGVDMWDEGIRKQVDAAIEGADILIFVTNVMDGVVALDKEVAKKLRSCEQEIYVVANKCDDMKWESETVAFDELGYGEIYPISCAHKKGIDDLLDDVLKDIDIMFDDEEQEPEPFRIAIVGRPNVGKSSLINAVLGEDRCMVSDIAGTTRDAIDVQFKMKYQGEEQPVTLIDTAGLRKKSKVDDLVEVFSVMRVESSIKRCDLVIFACEANVNGFTAQDRRIARLITESGKACVIVATKWDTCEGAKQKRVLDEIRYTLPRMNYAPIVFTSAHRNYNLGTLFDVIAEIRSQLDVRVPTSLLNQLLQDAYKRNVPPIIKRPLKVYYGTQVNNNPPTFKIFVNAKELCAPHYLGYLNNYLRNALDLTGLPIVINLIDRPKTIESFANKSKGKVVGRGSSIQRRKEKEKLKKDRQESKAKMKSKAFRKKRREETKEEAADRKKRATQVIKKRLSLKSRTEKMNRKKAKKKKR
jgi:GTP-binding protein